MMDADVFFYINQISQLQAALHMMCQRVHNLKMYSYLLCKFKHIIVQAFLV